MPQLINVPASNRSKTVWLIAGSDDQDVGLWGLGHPVCFTRRSQKLLMQSSPE